MGGIGALLFVKLYTIEQEKLKIDDSATGVVTREDIEEVVARWTGIAVTSIKEDEQQKLLRIEEELGRAAKFSGKRAFASRSV